MLGEKMAKGKLMILVIRTEEESAFPWQAKCAAWFWSPSQVFTLSLTFIGQQGISGRMEADDRQLRERPATLLGAKLSLPEAGLL